MRLFTFPSKQFIDTLLRDVSATYDIYCMSKTSECKYANYLYVHLIKLRVALKDATALIKGFKLYVK